MRKLLIPIMILGLTGCFGGPTMDASNEETIKASVQAIQKELPEADHEKFENAIKYFTFGGKKGMQAIMKAAFAGEKPDAEKFVLENLAKIDGLDGQEILAKYDEALAADKG